MVLQCAFSVCRATSTSDFLPCGAAEDRSEYCCRNSKTCIGIVVVDSRAEHRDGTHASHPSADLYLYSSLPLLVMLAGVEAIKGGRQWQHLADGMISGVFLGAAWKGLSIVSDRTGLTDQVSTAAAAPAACVHAYTQWCF